MFFLYNIIIHSYQGLIKLAALFNPKARLWVKGRKNIFEKIARDFQDHPRVVWFHAASLGEFEQGRPVLEAFKKKHPEYKILLTFFSPSGYEVRKDYKAADFVYYLPMDTKRNAAQFIEIVSPEAVFFIKYEFWFNYLNCLSKKNIKIYVISAIFRPDQHFFKAYGKWFRKQLEKISLFFVQDEGSEKLLNSLGIQNVIISGDTRFDRVANIAAQKKDYPLIQNFTSGKQVLLAGSSWPQDEKLLEQLIENHLPDLLLIIAPHEIHEERIQAILSLFNAYNPQRYSQLKEKILPDTRVLVIDGMGFLSGLYQYCTIAFIGGGFGKGIHNILEAVTFGKPVVFGPNYDKFAEAKSLEKQGGAFAINSENINETITSLFTDKIKYKNASEICKSYIAQNTGATQTILNNIHF